jgi:hypothetical protein
MVNDKSEVKIYKFEWEKRVVVNCEGKRGNVRSERESVCLVREEKWKE